MSEDPTIDEIRRVRHEISKEWSKDPEVLVAYFAELEGRYKQQAIARGGVCPIQVTADGAVASTEHIAN